MSTSNNPMSAHDYILSKLHNKIDLTSLPGVSATDKLRFNELSKQHTTEEVRTNPVLMRKLKIAILSDYTNVSMREVGTCEIASLDGNGVGWFLMNSRTYIVNTEDECNTLGYDMGEAIYQKRVFGIGFYVFG